jgi:type I restriction enzyme S subunit
MSAQQLITEHINLWTSTIKARKTQGRGSRKKRELYGIKKLRELILELAVRGKLVPQDPSDEPASVLLERIAKEKAQLIKDKKIKNQNTLKDITKEEAAFELPQGWEWTLLPNISSYKTGKTPATKNSIYWGDALSDYPWVSIADLNHYGRVVDTTKKVTQEAVVQVFKYPPVKAGTILMSFKLTLGKVSILDVDAFHNEAIISISPFTGVYKDYLFRVLPERALAGNSKKAIKGNTLNSESISRISIPLPPEAEQHRIVAKVDELMILCDQLEQQTETSLDAHNLLVDTLLSILTNARDANEISDNWARLSDRFDTLITTDYAVEQLKQTILQLAVTGKLVPQNPNDEPASELLKRIAAEKEQLIKDKKIKKQKPLPDITKEEKLFGLPNGWEWTQLGQISEIAPRNSLDDDLEVGFVPMQMISTSYKGEHKQEVKCWSEIKKGYTHFANGDVGLAKITPCFENSKAAVFKDLKNGYGAGTTELHIARPIAGTVDILFVLLYLKAPMFLEKGKPKMTGTAGQKRIPNDFFSGNPLPFPPLAEQHRIVAKVDELMALCDQLKTQLNDAQTTQLHLSDSVIENALTA